MSYLLYVGLIAEGSTDYRFLKPVIENVLIECSFLCSGDVDIEVVEIKCPKGDNFEEFVYNGCKIGAEEYGLSIIVVHADADSSTIDNTFQAKFKNIINEIDEIEDENICKVILPLIPVFETESWMLADKELFKKVVGTKRSNTELNLNGHPESYTNPKERIEHAIRIGRLDYPKKIKNQLTISNVYSPIGQSLLISNLENYDSYQIFKNEILKIFKQLNLLH